MTFKNTQLIMILNALDEQAESTNFGYLEICHSRLRESIETHLQSQSDEDGELDSRRTGIESQYSTEPKP